MSSDSMTAMLYGITQCDSVKKARRWLENNNIDYEFYDFRKQGVNPVQLRAWVNNLGYEALVNKRSTTWRNLPDETKQNWDETLALYLMEEQPTLIKRPILETSTRTLLGFSDEQYQATFMPSDD